MTTQLVPISKLDSLEKLNAALSALVARGEGIEVSDQRTDLQAKEFEIECKSYEKAVDLFADGEIQDLRERTSKAVAAKKALLSPMLRVFEMVKSSRRRWEEAERVATEKEQAKQNKRGGEPIEIKPAIPTLAGAQSRRLYKVKVESEDAILYEWVKAERGKTKRDALRALFLRSWIRVDEAAVQAVARSKEGWERLKAEEVPGLKLWTE
jgi:hypothetical protein